MYSYFAIFLAGISLISLMVTGAIGAANQTAAQAAGARKAAALVLARNYLSAQLAQQALAATPVTFAAPPSMAAVSLCPSAGQDASCGLVATADFSLSGGTPDGGSAPGTEQAPQLEGDTAVDEALVAVHIVAHVGVAGSSQPIVDAEESATLRVTKEGASYVGLSGPGVDASASADAPRNGCDSTGGCDPSGAGSTTTIDTQSTCSDPGCTATPIPTSTLAPSSLGNGNATSNGWRP